MDTVWWRREPRAERSSSSVLAAKLPARVTGSAGALRRLWERDVVRSRPLCSILVLVVLVLCANLLRHSPDTLRTRDIDQGGGARRPAATAAGRRGLLSAGNLAAVTGARALPHHPPDEATGYAAGLPHHGQRRGVALVRRRQAGITRSGVPQPDQVHGHEAENGLVVLVEHFCPGADQAPVRLGPGPAGLQDRGPYPQ